MCQQRQTMVLPLSAVKHISGVQISPPGVIPQGNHRPQTVYNLAHLGVNATMVLLASSEAIQFGQALWCILCQIHRADPHWDSVFIAKDNISNSLYNNFVNSNGVKQFEIILPTPPGQEPLVMFFLGLS